MILVMDVLHKQYLKKFPDGNFETSSFKRLAAAKNNLKN